MKRSGGNGARSRPSSVGEYRAAKKPTCSGSRITEHVVTAINARVCEFGSRPRIAATRQARSAAAGTTPVLNAM